MEGVGSYLFTEHITVLKHDYNILLKQISWIIISFNIYDTSRELTIYREEHISQTSTFSIFFLVYCIKYSNLKMYLILYLVIFILYYRQNFRFKTRKMERSPGFLCSHCNTANIWERFSRRYINLLTNVNAELHKLKRINYQT